MSEALYGRIIHRLHIPESSSDVPVSRKRRKPSDGNRPDQDEVSHSDQPHHQQEWLLSSGLIFVPNENSPCNEECLLSLPKDLLKVAYDAVQRKQEVVIDRWTEIHVAQPPSSAVDMPSNTSRRNPYSCILEVHRRGLELLPSSNQGRDQSSTTNSSQGSDGSGNLWTLPQFWRKELVDSEALKSSRSKFDIVATVRAISPIISLDPSHPIALVEIYDPANTDLTAIVVLNGVEALTCHSSTLPADNLIFRNVVYKAWSVPTILHQEDGGGAWNGRVPSHVFVATESECISWVGRPPHISVTCAPGKQEVSSTSTGPSSLIIAPPSLMIAIRGMVQHVETTRVSSGPYTATVIQYVDLLLHPPVSLSQSQGHSDSNHVAHDHCRLFLTHFPMPAALQISLREGAIVEGTNVHEILDWSPDDVHLGRQTPASPCKQRIICGACLRSTVVLLQSGGEAREIRGGDQSRSSHDDSTNSADQSSSRSPLETQSTRNSNAAPTFHDASGIKIGRQCKKRVNRLSLAHPAAPPWLSYRFWQIPQTYLEAIYRIHVEGWVRRNFQGSLHFDARTSKSVSKTWIAELLLADSNSSRDNTVRHSGCLVAGQGSTKCCRRRCPYAEFFDYRHSTISIDYDEDGDNMGLCHDTHIHEEHPTSCASSVLVDLGGIRSASQRVISQRIGERISESAKAFCVGWTGTSIVEQVELFQDLRIFNGHCYQGKTPKCFVGGFVSEVHSQPSATVAAISDRSSQVPIIFSRVGNEHARIGDFVIGKVDRIFISCLCLGCPVKHNGPTDNTIQKQDQEQFRNASVTLPSIHSAKNNLVGGSSLITVCGFLFVTSIQIHCLEPNVVVNNESPILGKVYQAHRVVSIVEYIDSPSFPKGPHPPSTVNSLIVRRCFQSKVNSEGTWTCCKIIVSGCPRDESRHQELETCCLQSFEYTLSALHSTSRNLTFNRNLEFLCPKACLSEAQKMLGSSFWALGDSGRTCALTFGGSDEFVGESRGCTSYVHLYFPNDAVHITDRGYVRLASTHEEIDAIMKIYDEDQSDSYTTRSSISRFDFEGATKVFPGMPCRRPRRRNVFGKAHAFGARVVGELCTTAPCSVIPPCTIFELFRLLCRELREPSERTKNPSMVRRISCGSFLGVTFCQVKLLCMRCRSNLVPTIPNKKQRQRYCQNEMSQPSFWHLPHPQEAPVQDHPMAVDSSVDVPIHVRQSSLHCPKQCPMHHFGVMWECSGILDDGTGRATLYADGDIALTLMGMSAETIQWIERGIWSTACGQLLYKKSIPPSQHLRDRVRQASSQKKHVQDPIRLLPPHLRAEYLLQRNCRSSHRSSRPLDFYVRCKPLSEKLRHLNHTTIDNFFVGSVDGDGDNNDDGNIRSVSSIHRGETLSYTLPPLKLELVDCGVPSWDVGSRFA
jgi:hypothetical protein